MLLLQANFHTICRQCFVILLRRARRVGIHAKEERAGNACLQAVFRHRMCNLAKMCASLKLPLNAEPDARWCKATRWEA